MIIPKIELEYIERYATDQNIEILTTFSRHNFAIQRGSGTENLRTFALKSLISEPCNNTERNATLYNQRLVDKRM